MSSGNSGFFAGAGSGWTNSGNITGHDGSYATAPWSQITSEGAADPTPTPTLNASSFGVSLDATILGIVVEVITKRTSSPSGTISAQLKKSGVATGSSKSLGTPGTTDTDLTAGSSSDLWGGSWTGADLAHLSVDLVGNPNVNGAGTLSIDTVKVTVYYENPTAFTFTDLTGQPLTTTVMSNTITVAGITTAAAVASPSPAEWRKNGGAWTSAAGTVSNGDTVQVRHTTSSLYNTTVNTLLDIGGTSDTFSSTTTTAADTTPDAFTFTDQSGLSQSVLAISAGVTITGINATAAVSISGGSGQYRVNSGAWTSSAGTCNNNDVIQVRVTTSGSFNTGVSTTLTVGGVSDTFTATTRSVDTTPNPFTFTDVSSVPISTLETSNTVTMSGMDPGQNATVTFSGSNGSGYQYSINGGAFTNIASTVIQNGQTLAVRLTSSASSGVAASILVNVGGRSDTYTATTTTGDTTPDAFTFIDDPGAGQNEVSTSNTIAITGIDATATVSFTSTGTGSAFQYRKNHSGVWGAWAALASDTVVVGDMLQVQLTAGPTVGDAASITMTVGGVSDSYNVTAAVPDSTPDPFFFTDVAGADTNVQYISNAITITGVNAPAALTLLGGQYRINGGAWTNVATTVSKGDVIELLVTSAATRATGVSSILTIDSATDTFTVTTSAPDSASQYVAVFRETVYGIDA